MPSISAGDVGGREGVHRYPGQQGLQHTPCDIVRPGVSGYKEVQPVALFSGAQICNITSKCEYVLEQVCIRTKKKLNNTFPRGRGVPQV